MSVLVTPDEFNLVLARLKRDFRVFAPISEEMGGRFSDTANVVYHEVNTFKEIVWQEKSHMSPRAIINPITETLFHFADQNLIHAADVDTTPVLIFARSCDINAMSRLDYMFLQNGQGEDYRYRLVRERIKFVLLECATSFENCFCVSMGTNSTDNYALATRFSSDGVQLEVADPNFTQYFQDIGKACEFTPSFVQQNEEIVVTPDKVCNDPQKIREIVQASEFWKEYDRRCIHCGRCTTGCPTCTCYSVFDLRYEENPNKGERRRQWSSCMIPGFSNMAGGHSFRRKNGEKLRYRALHKVNDYKARNKIEHMCVGCGRCDDHCPQYIKFSRIINRMTAAVQEKLQEEPVL